MIEVREGGGAATFAVRVQPRAKRDECAGEWQGALRVRLTAPPTDGRANEALRRLLAERLKVGVAAVKILAGEHSRTKSVQVTGTTAQNIRQLADSQK
jgi:uncharacterized protein